MGAVLETLVEFVGVVFVAALVYSATQSDSPREIARRSARLFAVTTVVLSLLAGGVALLSSL